jgi:hypothetical protein
MMKHLDTARSAALMPDEPCGGPCIVCGLEAGRVTADACIAYARARNMAGPWDWQADTEYAALLDADDAAWRVYHRMRRAYAGAAAMMKGTDNG